MKKAHASLPLALGTAQLGSNYGIANQLGKPDMKRARAIVGQALKEGIRFFDTAQAYGNSEKVLGSCLRDVLGAESEVEPAVISKLHPGTSLLDRGVVLKALEESISRLKVEFLWGFLLHSEDSFSEETGRLLEIGDRLKQEGRIRYFGISLYSMEKAIVALNSEGIDIVQIPFNIFDQRALRYGIFELASEKQKKVFVRSAYLQGLLVLDPGKLAQKMGFAKGALDTFQEAARKLELPPKLLALAFVIHNAKDAIIIIGSEHPSQVKENVNLFRRAQELVLPDLQWLNQKDPRLINPGKWRLS